MEPAWMLTGHVVVGRFAVIRMRLRRDDIYAD
jgi:hypothetical protein